MPVISDVFNSDAFGVVALSNNVNNIPYNPRRLEQLGIFASEGIETQHVAIQSIDGVLQLIPEKGLATFENYQKSDPKNLRYFDVPHLQLNDTVWAHELVGQTAFGGQAITQLETVQNAVTRCQQKLVDNHNFTWEWMRLNAVKGVLLDADGSTVLYDYFAEWGVTKKTLTYTPATTGDINVLVSDIHKYIGDAVGGGSYSGIHCLVGTEFMSALANDQSLSAAFDRYQDSAFYRNDYTFGFFPYRGIVFENYQGLIGGNPMVATDKGHAFPLGANAFKRFNAPGDLVEAVGTMGQAMYSSREAKKFNTGWEIYVQSNPLFMCQRPQLLIEIDLVTA